MAIRQRTTKLIARRHDLNYFKRPSRLRAWQWGLAGGALVLALLWFATSTFLRGGLALSAGPMSSSHASFGQRCETCHTPVVRSTSFSPSFGLRRHVPDAACLSCHNAGPHHPAESAQSPTCSSCHTEHVGAMHLAAVTDRSCTQCHAQLTTRSGTLHVAAHISSFAGDHPEFRELRTATNADRQAATALHFNHAEHLAANLSAPGGTRTLQCASCHMQTIAADGRPAGTMAPTDFDRSCRSCHSLEFDAHIAQEAPHASPEIVRAFVVQQVTAFAQTHPETVAAELRNWPAQPPLPARMSMPPPHSTAEWVTNRVARAEAILWREKCSLCHRDLNPESRAVIQPASLPLPQIEANHPPTRWFSSAIFSHNAHSAVSCADCHGKALSSSTGADILLPSIATCRRCHDGASSPQGPPVKTGHAESGCFLCHLYHEPSGSTTAPIGHPLQDLLNR